MCICLIILPNFNHRMHACARFVADKHFIKRRCYVRLSLTRSNLWKNRLDKQKLKALAVALVVLAVAAVVWCKIKFQAL